MEITRDKFVFMDVQFRIETQTFQYARRGKIENNFRNSEIERIGFCGSLLRLTYHYFDVLYVLFFFVRFLQTLLFRILIHLSDQYFSLAFYFIIFI